MMTLIVYFQVKRDSSCINKGVLIPGINDGIGAHSERAHGRLPDIGFESLWLRRA